MNSEKQRNTIAEACGADQFVGLKKKGLWWMPNSCGYTGNVKEAGRYTREEAKAREHVRGDYDDVTIHDLPFPDYLNDLNAMHAAESIMDYESAERFQDEIWGIAVSATRDMDHRPPNEFITIHATAPQRAEAFLKTLGLWKETECTPAT